MRSLCEIWVSELGKITYAPVASSAHLCRSYDGQWRKAILRVLDSRVRACAKVHTQARGVAGWRSTASSRRGHDGECNLAQTDK